MRWTFDLLPRLEALSARLKGQAKYLRLAMCDLPRDSEARELTVRRLDLVENRVRRLGNVSRRLRREARELATS